MGEELITWSIRLLVVLISFALAIQKGRNIYYKRKGRDRRVGNNPGIAIVDLKAITNACKDHEKETRANHDEIIRMQGRMTTVEGKLTRTCTENKADHTRLFSKIEELLVKVGR